MKYRIFSLGVLLAILSFSTYAAPTVVGKISFAKGSNAASQPNSAPRLLGKDAEVYQGDNIQTSDSSFVIVDFVDGSKVTIRPNSNFTIEQFDSASKNAKLTVHEGGVRAATGEFAKAGENNFQVKTPDATLKGEKDSDFSVRVCKGDDCNKDKKEPAKDTSVAKVVEIKGDVFAQNRADKNAQERKLTMGSGLNPQDFLTSQANSHLVMVFRDGEKVTLHPSSELDIVKYDFEQPGKKDQILFKLAAGGMRALTGSIGKKDKSAYALDTPVATIGIRGTDGTTALVSNVEGDPSTVLVTHEGTQSLTTQAGSIDVSANQAGMASSQNVPPIQIPVQNVPPAVQESIKSTPAPATAPDANKAFEDKPATTSKSGTAVVVNKGSANVQSGKEGDSDKKAESNKSSTAATTTNSDSGGGSGGSKSGGSSSDTGGVKLSAGESSFSSSEGDGHVEKLDEAPSVISQDSVMQQSPSESGSAPAIPLFGEPSNGGNGGAGDPNAGCAL
ncbi:MAG: FecR domain-containing protein [Methylococcales bacterium]|nr:FecR domain-containing protein [Methylococcales bacterium]